MEIYPRYTLTHSLTSYHQYQPLLQPPQQSMMTKHKYKTTNKECLPVKTLKHVPRKMFVPCLIADNGMKGNFLMSE